MKYKIEKVPYSRTVRGNGQYAGVPLEQMKPGESVKLHEYNSQDQAAKLHAAAHYAIGHMVKSNKLPGKFKVARYNKKTDSCL